MHFDVFNGDADGILALLQLRLAQPRDATLITGVKRDIALLKQLPLKKLSSQSLVTVLDISLDRNALDLENVIKSGAQVEYFDHHKATAIPESINFNGVIDQSSSTCTALLVNDFLEGRYANWAICAAFGDNITETALLLAKQNQLSKFETEQLKRLGTLINYNSYGDSVDSLMFHPKELYKQVLKYSSPFDFINDSHNDYNSAYNKLKTQFDQDYQQASVGKVLHQSPVCYCVLMEDNLASRRISGIFGNDLALTNPSRAHIVLTKKEGCGFLVSLRAPKFKSHSAGKICAQFETGGGRASAGGINKLNEHELGKLIQLVEATYG